MLLRTRKRRTRWKIRALSTTHNQSIRHKPVSSTKHRTRTTSVTASKLWSMIWLRRRYVLDDFPIDLQSRGELRLKKRMEASYLLFVWLHFFFSKASIIPFLPLSVSEELPHDVYQKEVNFQNVTFASNWLRTHAEMRGAIHSANYRAASGTAFKSRWV